MPRADVQDGGLECSMLVAHRIVIEAKHGGRATYLRVLLLKYLRTLLASPLANDSLFCLIPLTTKSHACPKNSWARVPQISYGEFLPEALTLYQDGGRWE